MKKRQKELSKKNLLRLKKFGETLSSRRKLLSFSQDELAEVLQIDRSYLSQLENGIANPTMDLLYRIQDCLELNIFIWGK